MATDFVLETAKVFLAFTSGVSTVWIREAIIEHNAKQRALRAAWSIIGQDVREATAEFDGVGALPALAREHKFSAGRPVPSPAIGFLERLVDGDVLNAPAYLKLLNVERGLFELAKELAELTKELLKAGKDDSQARLLAYDGLILALQSALLRVTNARLAVLRVIAKQISPPDRDAVLVCAETSSRYMDPKVTIAREEYLSR